MALIVGDDFTRSDSSTTLGGSWSVPMPSPGNSPWGIAGNRAYCVSPSTASFTSTADVPKNIAVIGSTAAPHIVTADITLSATSPNVGVVAKFVDTHNFIFTNIYNTTSHGLTVIVCVAGTYTALYSDSRTITKSATYTLRLRVDGSGWSVSLNGGTVSSGTLTAPQLAALSGPSAAGLFLGSGLYVGVSPNDPGDSRFDNFRFEAVDSGGWALGMIQW